MIITIDGTSASGKTTVARELAQRLGFALLRTGAMYRALAYAAHHAGLNEKATCEDFAPKLKEWQIDADEQHVFLNQADVSHEIEGNLMSHLSSTWAELPAVRRHITAAIQNRAGKYLSEGRSFVAEGRDQGSFVFPEAELKFYIDADVNERARRRLKDLHHREDWSKTQEQLAQELNSRDLRDKSRAFAPLVVPQDAIMIDSTHLSKQQVLERLFQAVLLYRGQAG